MSRTRTFALCLLLVAPLAPRLPAPPHPAQWTDRIDTLAIESHARFLADDLLEGRHPGTRGERLAGAYMVSQLHRLGLVPLPGHDYRLRVPLTAVNVDESRIAVRVVGAGESTVLRPPAFYHPGGSRGSFQGFSGDLVYAGAAADALDALGDMDLRGSVVVFTPPWNGITEAESAVMSRGATGTVSLIPEGRIYERLRIVRGPTRYFLPDGVDDPANQSAVPRVVGGPSMIDALGLAPDAIAGNALDRGRPLGRTFSLTFPFTTDERVGYNIAAWVPGADPAMRDEWIIYVAHYDHVGYGEPADGDWIWNGFIDNAAGSSMLLEIARNIARNPPPRSVAFLWVTAEEQGLLGSNWFVHESAIELDRIRAVINLDGGAPPAPPSSWGLTGADESTAGRIAHGLIERHGWPVNVVANGPQSDHWPFHRAGVPAMLLFPGTTYESLSEEEASALNARWYHPHTPQDEWHPDFPFAGLERYASLALEIGRELGGADATTGDRTP